MHACTVSFYIDVEALSVLIGAEIYTSGWNSLARCGSRCMGQRGVRTWV